MGESHVSNNRWLFRAFKPIGPALALGLSMSASASFLGFGGDSWKEEALLHDGSKILVTRTVEHGGRHEIGQKPPYKEQTLTFTLPSTNQRITWKDEYSEDLGSSNFNPMLVEVFGNTAYVLVTPAGCISYNKWGRPNPPYVVFKYQGKEWKHVPLNELPADVKLPNLVISSPDDEAKKANYGVLSVEMIKQANEGFRQPEYQTILRAPSAISDNRCLNLVPRKGGGWETPGGFRSIKSITIPPRPNAETNK